ncbi:ATP synthase subunit I [Paenibacillus abyssi]|uniref:ATP synthase subunit I n=1 Tax=Paenibacillus abyssi TaxID=1340531 RepID=A0A917FP00_9BACL|nr:ATP synthase subunit I [Paenibacillus abyssi]GGF91914.1 hypothetical protein GCM10010916_06580 [Paenibacillus abyssi]
MDEIIRRATRSALFVVLACLVMRFVVPEGKTVAAGLILGIMASLMNALLLRRRIALIDRVMSEQRPRRISIGMGSRLAMVLLVAIVALRFPEYFDLPSTLIGSFYVQFAILVTAFLHNARHSNGKG